ncbi:HMG box domain-containing protein [Caenorhabditis elegans]|uniref:HMG box domain-containing protein n=1 Tax=Caenorhabditis elegans TaxID=6239 RepID=Q9BL39_CAEEL|nr:HMG box domain-containing protein [Caenorhabditis elegans]CCD73870.1 HMG box domain-containing protein [Caenorhabditis elegans]|eukprot:NP_497613.2 SWI/SNF nucleosome remodeling complex component [Caenorhabditis elegans]
MSSFRHPQATPARNFQDMSSRGPKVPERPLQPYMRYSRKMWPKVRAENPEAQLWDIGKMIGKYWLDLPDGEKSHYQHEYELEKADYEKQMKHFQGNGISNFMINKGRAKNNEKMSRSRMDAGGVVIQPVDEDDGGNELSTRRLAGVRFERNNRLISDLFSPSIVTDTRTVVPHHRMEMLKRQATSLGTHQSKLEEELTKLERAHDNRKRAIEKGSDDFQEQLKKAVSEKPVVDEEKFEETVKEWEEKLATAYEEYKKKQETTATQNANSAPLLRNLVMEETPKTPEQEKEQNVKEKPAESTETPAAGTEPSTDDGAIETTTTTTTTENKEKPEEKMEE